MSKPDLEFPKPGKTGAGPASAPELLGSFPTQSWALSCPQEALHTEGTASTGLLVRSLPMILGTRPQNVETWVGEKKKGKVKTSPKTYSPFHT